MSAPTAGGLFNNSLSEQLEVRPNGVIYRTTNYISWKWHFNRIKTLMGAALKAAQDTVIFSSVRLEYLDRFWFDGNKTNADPRLLLKSNSAFVSPLGFSTTELWHSHSGQFLPATGNVKRLQQVMIDALDENRIGDATEVRYVNILTALENRTTFSNVDENQNNQDTVFKTFDDMHSSLKEMLSEIITKELSDKIYLMGCTA